MTTRRSFAASWPRSPREIIAGYRGAYLVRRELGGEVEFGLSRFDERSAHFDVLLIPQ